MNHLIYRDYQCEFFADDGGEGWEGVVTGAENQCIGTFFTIRREDIQAEFHTTVNEYLAVCEERGFTPTPPVPQVTRAEAHQS